MMNEEHNYRLDNFHPGMQHDPKHVGIIADGTGRWAKSQNIEFFVAYKKSMYMMAEIVEYCFEQKCEAVSLYLSSEQNFRRPEDKINAFCEAQNLFCSEIIPKLEEKYSMRVIPVGEKNLLPQFFQKTLESIEAYSKANYKVRLYLCVGYNPLREVLRAVSKSASPEALISNLDVPEPIDLVIRTGNANLLSNFLPIQSGYARIYVIKKLFPRVTVSDIDKIFKKFRKLNRKYGI